MDSIPSHQRIRDHKFFPLSCCTKIIVIFLLAMRKKWFGICLLDVFIMEYLNRLRHSCILQFLRYYCKEAGTVSIKVSYRVCNAIDIWRSISKLCCTNRMCCTFQICAPHFGFVLHISGLCSTFRFVEHTVELWSTVLHIAKLWSTCAAHITSRGQLHTIHMNVARHTRKEYQRNRVVKYRSLIRYHD